MDNSNCDSPPTYDEFLTAILGERSDMSAAEFAAAILGEDAPVDAAAFAAILLGEQNFNPDEPRDERGRWTSDGSATQPPPWLGKNRPGTRRQGRSLGGTDPAWRGRLTPTHEFTVTMDRNGDVHTYSWGNEPRRPSNPSGWFYDHPKDDTAAKTTLMGGDSSLGPVVGDESLNPYVAEAFKMLQGAGESSPSNHANGGLAGNCKTESDRLLGLAKALQAADQARPQDRDLLRERAKVEAGLKPKPPRVEGVPPPGR